MFRIVWISEILFTADYLKKCNLPNAAFKAKTIINMAQSNFPNFQGF